MNKDDLAYSLRLQSKRTDIPTDVVRSFSEAYQALQDVADAVSEMEAMLVDQRTEIKRLRHMEEVDQLLIKELLGKSEQLLKERDELRQQVENIKNGFEGSCYACEPVGEMNKRLQKERDDALVDQKLIEELWERRTDATEMQEQIKLLRKERDEARQQVCRQMLLRGILFHRVGANSICVTDPSDVAKWMGWDCYKGETT